MLRNLMESHFYSLLFLSEIKEIWKTRTQLQSLTVNLHLHFQNTLEIVETRTLCVSIVVDKDLRVSEMTFNIQLKIYYLYLCFSHVILLIYILLFFCE